MSAEWAAGYDEQGQELWRHEFMRKAKPSLDTIVCPDRDVEVAHKIVTSTGKVLKDRKCPTPTAQIESGAS